MSFDNTIQNNLQYKINLVAEFDIDGTPYYISKFQVDSGLIVPTEYVGLLDSVSVQAAQVDLRSVKTSIPSTTLKITDAGLGFTKLLGIDDAALQGRNVKIYIGFITGSFDFTDYVLQSNYFVKTVNQTGDIFTVACQGTTSAIQKRTFTIQGNVLNPINTLDTSVDVTTGQDVFPASGTILVKDEFMQYASKVFAAGVTTFSGLSRGDLSSTIAGHIAGDQVFYVERMEAENPIDALLKILLSTGSGTNGPYDVLIDGVGIDQNDINLAKFLQIKADFFPSDTLDYRLFNIEDTLKYLEIESFQANNIRLTEEEGILSIAVLDQSIPGDILPIVDSNVIEKKTPTFKISQNEIINSFSMQYQYIEGTKQYARTRQFSDANSIARYGVRRGSTLRFKAISSDTIANDRGTRFLNRFKSPQVEINVSQFLSTYKTPVGDKVNFTHPDISNAGSRGLNAEVELLKKAIDYASGTVSATYVFTSFTNLRRGLIAPCKAIVEVIDAKTIRIGIGEGVFYKAGYVLRLFNLTANIYFAEASNIVTSVTTDAGGDILTFQNDWINALAVSTALRFGLYDEVNDDQKARYAFIAPASGIFADGSGAYKIF